MSDSKHTPGPWRISGESATIYWLLAMIAAACCALVFTVVHTTDADGNTTTVCTDGGYAVECDCAKFGRKP